MLTIGHRLKHVCICLLILLFGLFPQTGFSQYTYELDKTTRFEKMGAEEGLSTGFTRNIHQDKYGFIWIGTQSGLNLFDGYEVKIFSANPKNPEALYNNHITYMFEDSDGTMWFCTNKGISRFNRANQTFSNYLPDSVNLNNNINNVFQIVQDGDDLWVSVWGDLLRFNKQEEKFTSFGKNTLNPSKGVYSNGIEYMFIDRSGVLWVGTSMPGKNEDFALNRFNKENESFTHFINNPSNPESLASRALMSIIEDQGGTIWVATLGGGLLELIDKEKGKFRHHTHSDSDPNSLLDNTLLVVFEDAKGNIWTGGRDGFSKLNNNTAQFTNYRIPPASFNNSLPSHIRDITEDDKGMIWLTSYDGFFRFDPYTNKLRHYLRNPEINNSLSNDKIFQILHSRSGLDWVLTADDGICIINYFSNSFHKTEVNSYDENALSGNFIPGILADSKGNLWIGTLRKGLNKTRLNDSRVFSDFEVYVAEAGNPNSLNQNTIFGIDEDKEQTVWIGTNNGLNRYNEHDNNFTRFEHDPNDHTTISRGVVDVAYEDSKGTFWVGTRTGLNIMDRKTGKFLRFNPGKNRPGVISSVTVRAIHEDSMGDLWIAGTYLDKLNRKDTSFINYFSDSIKYNEFEKELVWNIVEDDSANLWMTTYRGGILKFRRKDETFVSITTEYDLPSNTITAIEIDDSGYIWASTIQGLSRIDPTDYSIRNYDESDGLVNREFINNSSFKDKDGWLYFGGRNGFTYFHPDSIKENTFIPPVYITSLNVAGEPKYFDKPLYELKGIELQYDENDFSFDFVALNYINPQKNQYAFKLEGYDEDWNHVGNRKSAFYTNLSPGNYTFMVKGSNNDSYWNEEGASLGLIIHPPFWKTWWAYLIYLLFTVSILYGIARFYLRRQRLLRDLEIKHVRAEQLEELDVEKNKFFSNISHEFRTPLTLILGPLDRFVAKLKNEDQKQELSLVRRNARRLQTLINQLLSLSKLEEGKMKLRARPENIVKLTRLFLQSFHSMAEERGVKLEFESDAEEHIVYIDPIKYEKVVNNLLSNAFKFTGRGGEIRVIVSSQQSTVSSQQSGMHSLPIADCPLPTGDCIQIKVSDSGIGIKPENLPHVFDRFYQVDETQMKTNLGTGIGLALTKELVELHHGNIRVESGHDSYLDGRGTTFSIFLPMGKEHLSEDEIYQSGSAASEIEDELLNDDYLFAQDTGSKAEQEMESRDDNNLPLLLIVEDNEDMRDFIKSYLIDQYNIMEAANGKEGAEQAIEHVPDLIVSDLMMPKLDGNEMTSMLKTDERTSHIPIILLTAKASQESKLEGLETGADDFLTKPFDASELLIRINNLINQRKRLREVFGQKLSFTASPNHTDLQDSGITSMDEQFIKKAFETVEREMTDPEFDVVSFSTQMGMSRMQLHRKLKALTDQPASEFIKSNRLNKAAILLKSKSATAAEIAYDVGFSSPSYFSTCFKEHFGKTPSEYP